jgi:uncharacterized protein YegL
MANREKTEIIIVLDRSGSMGSVKQDMEGGLKSFLEDQKKVPGSCKVSLYTFDTVHETVFEGVNIKKVPAIVLEPRGGTALWDALGTAIDRTSERILTIPEAKRPASVIFLVITDGQENSSTKYKKDQVKQLVQVHERAAKWSFVYLGSDVNTANDAQAIGINMNALYTGTTKGVNNMYSHVSNAVSCARSANFKSSQVVHQVSLDKDLTV